MVIDNLWMVASRGKKFLGGLLGRVNAKASLDIVAHRVRQQHIEVKHQSLVGQLARGQFIQLAQRAFMRRFNNHRFSGVMKPPSIGAHNHDRNQHA